MYAAVSYYYNESSNVIAKLIYGCMLGARRVLLLKYMAMTLEGMRAMVGSTIK
jgi:hypothetical protein